MSRAASGSCRGTMPALACRWRHAPALLLGPTLELLFLLPQLLALCCLYALLLLPPASFLLRLRLRRIRFFMLPISNDSKLRTITVTATNGKECVPVCAASLHVLAAPAAACWQRRPAPAVGALLARVLLLVPVKDSKITKSQMLPTQNVPSQSQLQTAKSACLLALLCLTCLLLLPLLVGGAGLLLLSALCVNFLLSFPLLPLLLLY
jgi:hypothetical protein